MQCTVMHFTTTDCLQNVNFRTWLWTSLGNIFFWDIFTYLHVRLTYQTKRHTAHRHQVTKTELNRTYRFAQEIYTQKGLKITHPAA